MVQCLQLAHNFDDEKLTLRRLTSSVLKVARVDFSGSIPPHFERLPRRQ